MHTLRLVILALSRLGIRLVAATLLALPVARAATRLDLVHDLPRAEQVWLERLVEHFNERQREVEVRLRPVTERGPEAGLALLEPSLADPRQAAGKLRPMHGLLREFALEALTADLTPALRANVVDPRGRLLALPIAQSTSVLFFDKGALRRAGIDAESPPASWAALQEAAGRLVDAGSACPFSIAYPAVTLIEQVSAWHGEAAFAADGAPRFNGRLLVKQIALLASWQKSRYFVPRGRAGEADAAFANGECAMIISSAHLLPFFRRAGIDVGASRLPLHDDYVGPPGGTLADGRSLWLGAAAGRPQRVAAARFVAFLLEPGRQAELVTDGAFVPLTSAVPLLAESELVRSQLHGAQRAGALARRPRVQLVIDEELEAVWADRKPAKAALDAAVARITRLPRAGGA